MLLPKSTILVTSGYSFILVNQPNIEIKPDLLINVLFISSKIKPSLKTPSFYSAFPFKNAWRIWNMKQEEAYGSSGSGLSDWWSGV